MAVLHSAGEDRNLVRFSARMAVECILANLFPVFYARYVDNLFSLVEVGQPELAFDDWPW